MADPPFPSLLPSCPPSQRLALLRSLSRALTSARTWAQVHDPAALGAGGVLESQTLQKGLSLEWGRELMRVTSWRPEVQANPDSEAMRALVRAIARPRLLVGVRTMSWLPPEAEDTASPPATSPAQEGEVDLERLEDLVAQAIELLACVYSSARVSAEERARLAGEALDKVAATLGEWGYKQAGEVEGGRYHYERCGVECRVVRAAGEVLGEIEQTGEGGGGVGDEGGVDESMLALIDLHYAIEAFSLVSPPLSPLSHLTKLTAAMLS